MARSTKQLVTALEREKARLAKVRDALRDIEEDAQTQREAVDDALESLTYAIDKLSEYV